MMMRLQSCHILPILLITIILLINFRLLLEISLQSKSHMKKIDEETREALGRLSEEIHELDDSHQRLSQKNHVVLFIAVLNKLTSFERRRTIRTTWMSDCERLKVACKFFTDQINSLSGGNLTRAKDEINAHRDLIEMPYKGGIGFTLRLLWMFKWAVEHYTFDFFLRIDDDHFLCLDRLVYELPHRPKNSLYWGFIHCRERIVRVDEGWLMLTKDLIEEALSRLNSTLQCHPFADQAVALWMIESKYNVTYFYDNERVINEATAFKVKEYLSPSICDKYISLHGSYPSFMRRYWNITKQRRLQTMKTRNYNIPAIPRYLDKCPFDNKIFDFQNFWPEFRFETKPCKNDPRWPNSADEFVSREDRGEDNK